MTEIWKASSQLPGGGRAAAIGRGVFRPPVPFNEPPQDYRGDAGARGRLDAALADLRATRRELPLVIGGREVRTSSPATAEAPHERALVLADVHQARRGEVEAAISAAREAWQDWHRWTWDERAAVFLRAAALVAGPYRERLTAATMLDQSKSIDEAEADAACELADFLRFNVESMYRMLSEQPASTVEAWNRMEYRPLEGFVYAVSPFNFTAIGGNLSTAPAMLGNVVVWKPSPAATLGAALVMDVLREAGLPDGVVNLVYGDAEEVSSVALASPHLAGVHFTGSTAVFRSLWGRIGADLARYRSLPRLVGETGGKDFVLAHPSADAAAVADAVIRGGFEYQGQKCSAASRLFAPASLWPEIAERIEGAIAQMRVGDVGDDAYLGAVINEPAFRRHRDAIAEAASAAGTRIVAGGETDDRVGWFVHPTLIETQDADFRLLRDEIFGPIVTAYVYDDARWSETLDLVDRSTAFALTGSVFSADRNGLADAESRLEYTAGNLYVNDKPTGAMVGQQPFGGSRSSGTNDKTGTIWHLSRWASPRTVKESFLPPRGLPANAFRT